MKSINKLKKIFELSRFRSNKQKEFEDKVEFLNKLIDTINKKFGYRRLTIVVIEYDYISLMHTDSDDVAVVLCSGKTDIIESTIIGIMLGLSWSSEKNRRRINEDLLKRKK
jgi:hypothetical protein